MKSYQELVIEALKTVDEITVYDLHQLKNNHKLNLLDIREADEVAQGVIPGSIWIPRGVLEFQIVSLIEQLSWSPDSPIYLCCRSGNRSALAGLSLLDMGFNKPISVAGGFNVWRESGYQETTDILHF